MAKAKKKESVSLEEKLERVLVPVDEQPYEVPENWCWVHLLDAFDNLTDSKKKLATKEYLEEGMYSVVDQGQEFVGGYTNEEDMLYSGELPVVIFGDHTRCIKYVDFPFVQGADGVKVLRCKPFWDSKAFYYALKSVEIPSLGYRRHYPLFKELCVPVPPLAEQQRIVKQVEKLFAKLDEAKGKLEDSIEGIELRKSAILHKAFAGQLTEKWRSTNEVELSSWEHKVFKNILDVRDGTHDSPQYYDEGYPLITSKNLKNGTITDKDIKYISKEDYEQINLRSKVDIGDVLFAMIGTIGNPVVVTAEPNYAIKNMALFKNIGKLNPFFLKYYLESKVVKDKMQKEAKGSTQKFVALGYLRDFPICVPSADEQAEIVKLLDAMLTQERDVEIALQSTVEQIEIMKKSILAKAFRGKIGTNNPEEEATTELLKSILSQE